MLFFVMFVHVYVFLLMRGVFVDSTIYFFLPCCWVIPCQTSKNKTKMSPWIENFKIDIFREFYI
jgi:hypothetical protein